MPRLFLFAIALLVACSGGTHPERERQQAKVTQAENALRQERGRLQTMRDSLTREIDRNIALGIPKERAERIERARIEVQETLVAASKKNLMAQRALLDSLKKYLP